MTADPADEPKIDFASAANATVLRFLGVAEPELARATSAVGVDRMILGTHPDLVDYLWKLGASLPGPCACVVDGRSFPLLSHPESGVVFAVAGGTNTLGLRLPGPELAAALDVPGFGREYVYPSGPVRAAELGDDWALVRSYAAENAERCRRAFAHAGTLG
jgi:hypothetical protein